MTHVVVDPVTRIEGHLRIEAEVDGGKVQDAWSSVDDVPRHRADPEGPRSARRLGLHPAHLRRLHDGARDRLDPRRRERHRRDPAAQRPAPAQPDHRLAVRAGPRHPLLPPARARLGRHRVGALGRSGEDLRPGAVDLRLAALEHDLLRRRPGPREGASSSAASSAPSPTPTGATRPTSCRPRPTCMAVAHYLEALDWQREFIKIHAILGGKNPHLQSFLVGGMATPVDPDRQASLNAGSIAEMRELDREGAATSSRRSTSPTCWPSPPSTRTGPATAPASATTWSTASTRRTTARTPPLFLPSGVIRKRDLAKVETFDPAKITEQVKHSWYEYDGGDDKGAPPVRGRDEAELHRARSRPTSGSTTDAKYSWLKSPRYDGQPMEVGPLARMLVAYASGHAARQGARRRGPREARRGSRGALLDARPRRGPRASRPRSSPRRWTTGSTSSPTTWRRRELRIHDNSKWEPTTWPTEASGAGFHEAPRGALGHWVHIRDGQIANYQCVVPSTWNAGPRDAAGNRGPYEEALLGTPVADPDAADRDPAHGPLLRPLHGLRRPRRRRAAARARAREGPVSTARPLVDPGSDPAARRHGPRPRLRLGVARAPDALADRHLDLRSLRGRASTSAARS